MYGRTLIFSSYMNGKLYRCGNGYGSDVFPWVITTLRFFGLAKVPVGWDRPENAEDLTMEDLMSAGWKFDGHDGLHICSRPPFLLGSLNFALFSFFSFFFNRTRHQPFSCIPV